MRGPRARFPVEVRVRTGRDYRDAFADSRRVSTRHFSLHLRTRDGGFCRLGMAVSRKVSPNAVIRNRVKRQIRESFRLTYPSLPSGDCVIVARVSAGALDRAALRADLDVLWQRLRALPPAEPTGKIATSATVASQPSNLDSLPPQTDSPAPNSVSGRVTE